MQTEEDPWLALITETGHLINELREEYLKDFAHHFSWVLERLDSKLSCHFEYNVGGYEKNLADTRKKMTEALQREVKLGNTQLGPHRADLITAWTRPPPAKRRQEARKSYCQRGGFGAGVAHGGQASATVAGKLIDDIGAEFDSEHRMNLLQVLAGIGSQVEQQPQNRCQKL
ncbi:MAG: hypothetical protein CM15mP68_7510 [Pseudomonadota bacterium]|nr:MAG: hypothetical protein CM15mP68_7510 [Pseudomonadota bacterium]